MILRPYQEEATECTLKKFEEVDTALCVMATGLGKCFAKDTPIMLYSGKIKPVQDIRTNDLLMGPDSTPRQVTSTCTGREEMYKITPVKGEPYVVNKSHILSLKITGLSNSRKKVVTDANGNKYASGEIANINVTTYLRSNRSFKHAAKGYRVAVEFESTIGDVFPPYILGLWLGDGHSYHPAITTKDPEIIEELDRFAKNNNQSFKKREPAGKAWTYHLTGFGKWDGNKLLHFLKIYGLLKHKHIPHEYKTGERVTRLEILAGLIDTDGSLNKDNCCYDFINKNKTLSNDVVFIARSLGLFAAVKKCRKQCGNNKKWGDYYRVQISGNTSIIPCRIKRKRANKRKQVKNVLVTGINVESVGEDDYYGFTLRGADRRFLLGDFTVAHNTVYFVHLMKHFMEHGRIMVLAHREELIFQAQDKVKVIHDLDSDIEMGDNWASRNEIFKADIVISTIQTQCAGRNGGRMTHFDPDEFSLLVIDECHHAPAASYRRVIDYYRQNPKLKVLGVTATPDRTDKKAMGQIFAEVAYVYGIRDAIDDGWLVNIQGQSLYLESLDYSQIRTTAGDLNGKDLAEVLEYEKNLHPFAEGILQYVGDKKTLIFAASVAHAERLTEILNRPENKPGSARFVCGTTPKEVRRDILKDFAGKAFQYLVNVGIATEGFDDPSIESVVMARPTKSRTLYAQMVGRGTRPLPGIVDLYPDAMERREAIANSAKPYLQVIDFVGNAGRHKLVTSADILGGRYTDKVVELAKKNIERESDKQKTSVDIATELQKAEQEIAKRYRDKEDAIARDHILLRAKFSTAKINPFNVLDVDPYRERPWHKGRMPTSGQLNYLQRYGVNTDGLSFTHASQIIDRVIKRRQADKCTYKQAKVLQRYGYDIDSTFRQASEIIDRIAKNGWRKTAVKVG